MPAVTVPVLQVVFSLFEDIYRILRICLKIIKIKINAVKCTLNKPLQILTIF